MSSKLTKHKVTSRMIKLNFSENKKIKNTTKTRQKITFVYQFLNFSKDKHQVSGNFKEGNLNHINVIQ